MLFDSQCLIADPYVGLALAAAATRRLGLGVGVTNPITRHAAVTASAIAAVQEASSGRAVLGIGRGNSSLAFLGAAPAPIADFEDYIRLLQAYLAGGAAPIEQLLARRDGLRPLDRASLGRAPEESRLEWLDPAVAKVPVEVAATGPRAIALGARLADRLSFALGADEGRLGRAVAAARAAAQACGRVGPLPLTAYVSVIALADRAKARRLAAPDVAMHAHMGTMSAANLVQMPEAGRRVVQRLAETYDMTRHARHGAQTEALDDAFIDAHAITGPAEDCVERLRGLAGLGLDRLILLLPPPLKGDTKEAYEAVVSRVLPAFAGGPTTTARTTR
jgi:5,10-methylenetetrahydromethanopterin reductase